MVTRDVNEDLDPEACPTSGPAPGEVAAAQREQRRAFAAVVEPEIEMMWRVARGLSGSTADAEDLLQESLVRAFRAVDRFDGRHPRAWLLTIVRNTHLNLHRRRRPIVVDDSELINASRPAFGAHQAPGAEEVYVTQELDAALSEAIGALDARLRSALLLVDVHDLSYAEAAAVLASRSAPSCPV